MGTKPRSVLIAAGLTAAWVFNGPAFADESARYSVAKAEYKAENPASRLHLDFSPTGLVATPDRAEDAPWTFDLRLLSVSIDGQFAPLGPAKRTAFDHRVEYEFGGARASYVNGPDGLIQKISITAPENRGKPGALSTVSVELSIDGELVPVLSGYFVDMLKPSSEAVLRFGPADATGADGARLDARLEVTADSRGSATGVRLVVDAVDPVYPIEVSATLAARVLRKGPAGEKQAPPAVAEIVGVPVAFDAGITETVDQLMARERLRPAQPVMPLRETHHELELEDEMVMEADPNAPPPLSHWPPIVNEPAPMSSVSGPVPLLPQTVGTSFKGVGSSESGFIPPDSMGDVGPTQILMHVNGRIKVFSKTGVVGGLNVSDGTFWSSVASSFSDPMVRYDRLSGRWFVLGISLENTNNKVLLAVSSGPTISSAASFTFFSFTIGSVSPGESVNFCDYPGLGIDANALYVGCNMFRGTFHTSAFVIRKTSVTGAPPMVVTGFPDIGSASSPGPYAPRGVDNDDPAATQGYIIGTDPGFLNRINIRRISNPGGTPTMGSTITLAVSNTNNLDQAANGSTTNINASDARLFSASIHKNKISGVSTLWTAHSVETDTTCTPANSGNSRRLGAKWYEIANLSTTPTITQFGTLCTTTTGAVTSNTQRGFIYPTVVASGQGHMALAASYASSTEFVGVAAAGRLRTDPLGGTRAPETLVVMGSASYTVLDPNRNRWGDYSFTDVDPNDDQTIWTIQEYADTPANNWSVRAVQLKAPAPPVILTTTNAVCAGVAAAPVTIVGSDACTAPTCTNGLCTGGGLCPEFFDPGPDTGGPGYANHIGATVTGSITVNSANIVIPASPSTQRVTQVALSLNTLAASPGLKTVTITNPDGQGISGINKISVVANRVPVAVTGTYVICQNGSVQLNGTASTDPDSACGDSIVSYEWDLNNDGTFDITGATPTVTYAQLTSLGLIVGPNTIKLRVTDSHTAPATGTGTLTLVAEGGSCNDSNACTQTDTCTAGSCVGSNPVVCTSSDQCHNPGVCDTGTGVCSNPNRVDGSSCNDANACTLTDTCQTGICVGGSPKNCSDGNTCTSDNCDIGTGACSNPNVANGTGCNDANLCTQTDSCQTGICTGANPIVCSPSDQCHVAGVCNPGTGVCSNPNAPDGNSCNDANPCTQTDGCQTGVCTGGNPVVCSASDPCHVAGVCNTGTGLCSNPNAPNGTGCNDGDACTVPDACQSGVCVGTPVVCTPTEQCHAAGTCTAGVCSDPLAPDGTGCDDADGCTTGETCTAGTCGGGTPTPPGELQNARFTAPTTLVWDTIPNSPSYDVLRGDLAALPVGPGGGDESCFNDLLTAVLNDPTPPSPGSGFWYVVRGSNTCGVGGYGTQHNLTPRTSTTCP